MTLQFLSSEWIAALDAALRARPELATAFAASPLCVGEEVLARDGTVVRYVVVLDGNGGRVDPDAVADLTFVADYETAADLARGVCNAQVALSAGRLKVRGGVDRLAVASGALATLGDTLADLRTRTSF